MGFQDFPVPVFNNWIDSGSSSSWIMGSFISIWIGLWSEEGSDIVLMEICLSMSLSMEIQCQFNISRGEFGLGLRFCCSEVDAKIVILKETPYTSLNALLELRPYIICPKLCRFDVIWHFFK